METPRFHLPSDTLADFCRRWQISDVALFGSALRDDFGPESDFDFLVEFEPGAEIGFMGLARLQRELAHLLGRPDDLVPKGRLRPLIRNEILASAQVLYAASGWGALSPSLA